jgi:hypothetical protein
MSKDTTKTQRLQPVFDYEGVSQDRQSAERFLRRLIDAATLLVPDREWSPEDLREVIEFASSGATQSVPVLSARQYRKRLKEETARSDRYKQTFSTMIVRMTGGSPDDDHATVLDALIERLRKTDMVFLYKRHVAILLPHTGQPVLQTLVDRIRALIAAVSATELEQILIEATSYPSREFESADALLKWVDARLAD